MHPRVFAGGCLALSLAVAPADGRAAADCGWTLVPTVNPFPSGNQLVAVSGASASDVWEVGASFHERESRGYAIHWNGATWTIYHEANPSKDGGRLSGVAEIAPNDVWVAGTDYGAPGYAEPQPRIEHFDGKKFETVEAPPVPGGIAELYGLKAFASNDVWGVGVSLVPGQLQLGYIVHWDGSAWSWIPSAQVSGAATNPDSISGSSSSDVWAVGGFIAGGSSGSFQTFAEHWNGSSWSRVPTPNVNGNSNILNAVVVNSPTDAWALGDYSTGTAFNPLTEHWDGNTWSIVPSPNTGTQSTYIFGGAALGPRDVWAVGEIAVAPATVEVFTMQWNGSQWTVVPGVNIEGQPVTLFNGAAAIPGSGVWAVGGDADFKTVHQTVTESNLCAKGGAQSRR